MRTLVATSLTAALAITGCSSSRCGQAECCTPVAAQCTVPQCTVPYVPPQPSAPPPPAPEQPAEPAPAPPPPAVSQVSVAPKPLSALEQAIQKGYGQGENHEWLVGRLQRVHVPGSEWKLRYLPITQVDDYGGSVIMSLDARVDEFKDGDLVYVEGEIIANRPTLYLNGPLYRISAIRAVPEQNRIAAKSRMVE